MRGVGEADAVLAVLDRIARATALAVAAPPKELYQMTVRQQQTVQTLLEALPYIRRFNGCTMVVEIAGATLWSNGLTASFAGEIKGGQRHGVYAILSGTGLYANATGTGTFESLPSKLEGATILNTKLNVKTP